MLKNTNPKAVCVSIIKDDKVLGVARRNNPNAWGLPGGKVDPGEEVIDAAIRELKEETGIIVNRWELVEIFTMECGPGKDNKTFDTTSYKAISWTGEPKQGDAGEVKFIDQQLVLDGPFGEYNKVWLSIINETTLCSGMFAYLARTKPGALYSYIVNNDALRCRAIEEIREIPNLVTAFEMCIELFENNNINKIDKESIAYICYTNLLKREQSSREELKSLKIQIDHMASEYVEYS